MIHNAVQNQMFLHLQHNTGSCMDGIVFMVWSDERVSCGRWCFYRIGVEASLSGDRQPDTFTVNSYDTFFFKICVTHRRYAFPFVPVVVHSNSQHVYKAMLGFPSDSATE